MDHSRPLLFSGENRVLASLSREMKVQLLPKMEKTALSIRQLLYEAHQPIRDTYFPLSGVVSLLVGLKSGQTVEVATIGNEGVVGTPLFFGAERGALNAVCQVAGQALKMRADHFQRSLDAPEFRAGVRRYAHALFDQMAQTTACNHVHSVQQRMCRWLLMTHDRVGSDQFQLTQELLAQMLGVRRPSVTVAAGALQKAGLIRYQRGRIRIIDRAGLEARACECYKTVREEFDRLIASG
jgi:CRP-like cAMP-binding protein